jgi:hypothetical protein
MLAPPASPSNAKLILSAVCRFVDVKSAKLRLNVQVATRVAGSYAKVVAA